MNGLKLKVVKWLFRKKRADIYLAIENSISQTGTKRQELISDTFKRWADREAKRGKWISHAYRAIQKRLESGKSLSESLQPFIPVEEMLTIQSGERGVIVNGPKPKLAVALESARRQKSAGDEMKSAVKGALAEPIAQVIIFILMSLGFGGFVWPEMVRAFPLEYWPGWAAFFIEMQIGLYENWYLSILGIGVVIAYYWSLPNWTGNLRTKFDKFPPYSIYRDRMASAALGTLGGLLHSQLTLEESLTRMQKNATPYFKWHLIRMKKMIPQSGKDPMKALSTGLFSREILDQIEDAASSREFDETLTHIGHQALGSIIGVVKRSALAATVVILALVAFLFLYMTAVQIFGVQDAADNFSANQGSKTVKIQ